MDDNWTAPAQTESPRLDPWSGPGGGDVPPTLTPAPIEAPKRSRGLLFATIASIALVVLAVGAVFALRGGDGGNAIVEVEDSSAFSLAAAAERATKANTVQYDVSMTLGALGELSMSGGIDTEAQIMTFTMDVGAILGGVGGQSGDSIEAIIDVGNGVMYMSAGGLGFPADTEWVSMDIEALAGQSGMSIEDFQDQFGANPLDVAELFTAADAVVDLGPETIDGVTLRHYRVTVDLADALAANPQLEQQVDLGQLGAELPSEIDYDVWVTEDNLLRRMTFALDMLGQEMAVEMNVTDIGSPLDVQIPAPHEVTDLGDLVGG